MERSDMQDLRETAGDTYRLPEGGLPEPDDVP